MHIRPIASLTAIALTIFLTPAFAVEYLTGIEWQEPPMIKPGDASAPPSDAIILFDGKDLSKWNNGENWPVKDGVAFSGKGMITTKDEFGDCQLHIEWASPSEVQGESQARGNSGVFLMGKYELQILDSFDNKTYFDGQASAIYKQTPPMANAMRPPGEWNTYDILWTCPRFNDDGSLKSPAYITVIHNGVATLNHFELLGDTPFHRPPEYNQHPGKGPISLQDHGNPVRFRNIWVRELKPPQGKQTREPFLRDGDKETPIGKQAGAKVKVQVILNGKPIAKGKVLFTTDDGKQIDAEIDRSGNAQFQYITPGIYRVSIKSGYANIDKKYDDPKTSGLVIEAGKGENDIQLDLQLP